MPNFDALKRGTQVYADISYRSCRIFVGSDRLEFVCEGRVAAASTSQTCDHTVETLRDDRLRRSSRQRCEKVDEEAHALKSTLSILLVRPRSRECRTLFEPSTRDTASTDVQGASLVNPPYRITPVGSWRLSLMWPKETTAMQPPMRMREVRSGRPEG